MGKLLDKVLGKWRVTVSFHPYCAAIVPAAGSSERMGGADKLTADLLGEPVLVHTLRALDEAERVDEIVVAVRHDRLEEMAALCDEACLMKPVRVVEGGKNRAESVLLAALAVEGNAELLAIHDGARPLILPEQIDEMIALGERTYAAAPALPVTDTVKVADDIRGVVKSTPDRKTLFAVQTPQVFQADIVKAALQSALDGGVELTDDCSAVERLGKEVYLTAGWRENIKITTPQDLTLAEALLRQREAL